MPELFDDFIENSAPDDGCRVLVVYGQALSDAARSALAKSFVALGFGDDACMFASLTPLGRESALYDGALDAQALFLLVEGLDPLRLVAADRSAAHALAECYRTSINLDSTARVFGRPAIALSNLSELITTDAGKQKAWALLKTLL